MAAAVSADSRPLVTGTTRTLAAWVVEHESRGYPSQMVRAAANRALETALWKAKPVRGSAYEAALEDILAHELSLQVDWIKGLQGIVQH